MLHLNIASLNAHFDELQFMLHNTSIPFDFVCLCETGIRKNTISSFDIPGYNFFECLTKSKKGGTRIYVSNKHNVKPRTDLHIYKKKLLESVFVEIVKTKGKNIIIGTVYKHPTMTIDDFHIQLSKTLEKLGREKKQVIIMGDFNIDLIRTNSDEKVADFLNLMLSNALQPLILRPTRITTH